MFFEFVHSESTEEFSYREGCELGFPAHIHRAFEFIMVRGGCVELRVNDKIYYLTSGQAALIFPYCVHSYRPYPRFSYSLCLFAPEFVSDYYSKVKGYVPVDCSFEYTRGYDVRTINTYMIKGYVYDVCGTFDRTAEYVSVREDDSYTLLMKMLTFAEENYASGTNLKTLADKLSYDYAYISKLFKRVVGISYHSYILKLRVAAACRYLTGSDLGVMEIAVRSGFGCLRSFDREFRRQMNMSPREYRAINGGNMAQP